MEDKEIDNRYLSAAVSVRSYAEIDRKLEDRDREDDRQRQIEK